MCKIEKQNSSIFHDVLTNVLVRSQFLACLECAGIAREHDISALIIVDLNNFKEINSTMGYEAGDFHLQKVADILRRIAGKYAILARLSGGEFGIILRPLGTEQKKAAETAIAVGNEIIDALSKGSMLNGIEYFGSANVGISVFSTFGSESALRQATIALRHAKIIKRKIACCFDDAMYISINHRASIIRDLQAAFLRSEFFLAYQPQVNASGVITGVEALARWTHPVAGPVSPDVFIPAAEESGLIIKLGQWALDAACRQLSLWSKTEKFQRLTIAVNISLQEYNAPNFVDCVIETIARTGAIAANLKIELTESLIMESVDDAVQKMHALRAFGVKCSMDDFGTGFSSLSRLKLLPLDQLKIDKSFVADMLTNSNGAAIVNMIISLAKEMGLEIIAEGVETVAQRDFLSRNGCLNFQGHLYSPAIPIADFEKYFFEVMDVRLHGRSTICQQQKVA